MKWKCLSCGDFKARIHLVFLDVLSRVGILVLKDDEGNINILSCRFVKENLRKPQGDQEKLCSANSQKVTLISIIWSCSYPKSTEFPRNLGGNINWSCPKWYSHSSCHALPTSWIVSKCMYDEFPVVFGNKIKSTSHVENNYECKVSRIVRYLVKTSGPSFLFQESDTFGCEEAVSNVGKKMKSDCHVFQTVLEVRHCIIHMNKKYHRLWRVLEPVQVGILFWAAWQ